MTESDLPSYYEIQSAGWSRLRELNQIVERAISADRLAGLDLIRRSMSFGYQRTQEAVDIYFNGPPWRIVKLKEAIDDRMRELIAELHATDT